MRWLGDSSRLSLCITIAHLCVVRWSGSTGFIKHHHTPNTKWSTNSSTDSGTSLPEPCSSPSSLIQCRSTSVLREARAAMIYHASCYILSRQDVGTLEALASIANIHTHLDTRLQDDVFDDLTSRSDNQKIMPFSTSHTLSHWSKFQLGTHLRRNEVPSPWFGHDRLSARPYLAGFLPPIYCFWNAPALDSFSQFRDQ